MKSQKVVHYSIATTVFSLSLSLNQSKHVLSLFTQNFYYEFCKEKSETKQHIQ